MATEAYTQEFPIELIFSLPFKQIFEFARKMRDPNRFKMEVAIGKLAHDNREDIVDLLSSSLIRAMDEDIVLGEVSNDTMKEIKTKVDYLNEQFRSIDSYFESLKVEDQRKLILPFMEKELTTLINYKDKFAARINSKSKWNDNDSIIYTYYSLYQENMAVYRKILKTASREKIGSVLNIIKIMVSFYKSVLLAYMLDKPLKNEVVIERLSELRANINPERFYLVDPKCRAITEALVAAPAS